MSREIVLNDFLRAKKNDALVSNNSCFARQRLRSAALASLATPTTAALASLVITGLRPSATPPDLVEIEPSARSHFS